MLKPKNLLIKNLGTRHLHIPNREKPSLLFIPGNLQEIETINDLNKGFSRNFDYHVIELPGTGLTKPLHPIHHVEFLAECLDDFINQTLNSTINLVTCSYATAIGIEFAKKYSNKINKLVMAGSMEDIPTEKWPTILELMADCTRNPRRFANGFMKLITSSDENIPKLDIIKKATMRKASHYSQEQLWCFIYNSIRLMSYKATDLEKITAQTLCFTGEFDPYVTPDRCSALSSKIPNSQFKLIKDADHLFHIEKPKETINLITSFLLSKDTETINIQPK